MAVRLLAKRRVHCSYTCAALEQTCQFQYHGSAPCPTSGLAKIFAGSELRPPRWGHVGLRKTITWQQYRLPAVLANAGGLNMVACQYFISNLTVLFLDALVRPTKLYLSILKVNRVERASWTVLWHDGHHRAFYT